MCACASGPRPPERAPGSPPRPRPELHEGLAVAVARRFRWAPVPFEDLLQAARLGLVRAAARYDPASGLSFATYAVPVMLGEVRRLVEKSRPVSGIRSARALVEEARRCRDRMEAERGRPVALEELARALGVEGAELAAAVGAVTEPLPLEESWAGPRGREGEEAHREQEWADRFAVREAIRRLPAELGGIVFLRYFQGRTQQEVARSLGLSQPAVSRRERRALEMLRQDLEGPPPTHRAWRQMPEGEHPRPSNRLGDGGRRPA